MQIFTWLTPEDEMYCAATPRAGRDTAIADRPADMPQGRYNREKGQWERVYEAPGPQDISLGEAERLWAWAEAQGEGMAGIILKALGL